MRKKINNPCAFSITLPYDTAIRIRKLCDESNVSLTEFFFNASLAHMVLLEHELGLDDVTKQIKANVKPIPANILEGFWS